MTKKKITTDYQAIAEELAQENAQLTEALQRERADATNIRRRHEEQIGSLKDLVKTDIIKKLLPVIDNFERALGHIPKDLENHEFTKGIQGLVKQFEKTLIDLGIERIKTVGEMFDPRWHEAVSYDGGGTEEVITVELQAGYRLGDEIIRPAMVRVS